MNPTFRSLLAYLSVCGFVGSAAVYIMGFNESTAEYARLVFLPLFIVLFLVDKITRVPLTTDGDGKTVAHEQISVLIDGRSTVEACTKPRFLLDFGNSPWTGIAPAEVDLAREPYRFRD